VRAVADAGPIIHLSWLDLLDILTQVFEEISVPTAVEAEVTNAASETPGILAIRTALSDGWLTARPVQQEEAVERLRAESGLDRGESEAIVLFRELGSDILLLDDRRARLYAEHEGLALTGTIGILRLARNRNLIPSVSEQVKKLQSRGFRISEALAKRIEDEEG
jgi:predicted nucleic acid-binding protein